ncbi:porin [Flavobacterium sp. J49]|uniref:outer membrane beta-barrel protein n=1 Tax=Flavobacterium sp. J49 TaxID=2718534 RepID=UPI0015938209|nr:outer membrane beta-barrel protein [Flavobacterium sp. J49]MBF6642419.1 porin [Flavobacterium sp. J49]NIC03665.1 porin [Flavobacterium sp. J49]
MRSFIKLSLTLLVFNIGLAQENKALKLSFSGYLETYYAYDFNRPETQAKLPFMYNYNRHNEFNINVGVLRAKAEYDNAYATIALHSGTYVEDNFTNENTKIISEAYLGLYLDETKKSTVEVGILPSYIGFESATSASNLTLTRSLLAENSPYFMTGAKYTYKPNGKWLFSGLVTNGWQRINKPDKNVSPALGSQIVFKPSTQSTFNWSTFIGKELYYNEWGMRYFSNLYWDKQWNSKWRTILGFDAGLQTDVADNDTKLFWMSPAVLAQYSWTSKWQTAFRIEYYQDKNNVMVGVGDAFKTFGTSFNLDYLINDKVKFRTEARYLSGQEKVFVKETSLTNDNLCITTSLSFEF